MSPEFLACQCLIGSGTLEELLQALNQVTDPTQLSGFTLTGETLVHVAVDARHPAAIASLIAAGVSPNKGESQTLATPLHYAVARDDLESLETLLALGADPNKVDKYGNPPLWHAVLKFNAARPDCIRPLLRAGADIDIANNLGRSVRWHLGRTTSDFIRGPFRECNLIP